MTSYVKEGGKWVPSSDSSEKSGDKKLREYRERQEANSSNSTSGTIKPMTEEERKANQLITSDVERSHGIDRTKEALAKLRNEEAKAEFEQGGAPAVMGASVMPTSLPDINSMYPEGDFRNHLNQNQSLVGTVRQKIGAANQKVSSYIPSYEEVIARRDQLEQSNEEFGKRMQLIRDTAHQNERVGSAVDKFATFGKGIYDEVDENPVGVAVTAATWIPGGAALKVGSTAGKLALLRAASVAGSGSKIGKGLTITTKVIDPVMGAGFVALTANELKDKNAEELGHFTPHLIGGLIGGAIGWRAASGAAYRMEMNRAFNARYEQPSTLTQVDGPRNAVRPLNSEITPIETSTRVAGNPLTNELRIIESTRRGGQTVEPNVRFGDNVNDVSPLKPKDTTIRSEIKIIEEGTTKPQKFQLEMEAPKTESITIQSGRVKSQFEIEVPAPETPLRRVTAKRRNLKNTEETPSQNSIWQDETAQLMTHGEVTPSSQLNRPLFQRGSTSEIIPERTMLFRTNVRTPTRNVVPLFFTAQTHKPVIDTDFVKDRDTLKDEVQDVAQKKDTPVLQKTSLSTSLSSTVFSPATKPTHKSRSGALPISLEMPIPVVEVPTKRKSKKKRVSKQKKDAWEYGRTTNKYKSPLDVKVKGKGLI